MTRDRAVALAVAVAAAAGFAGTYTFDRVPAALMQGLGAVEWPRAVCLVILALAAVLAFGQRPAAAPAEAPASPGPVFWWTLAACAGFVAATALAGMLAASFAFLVGVGWLWGERRWRTLLTAASGTTAAIWLVFVRGFGVQLPLGLFDQ